jgi:hypothetical protein
LSWSLAKNAFENPALRPSTEALVHDFPIAETLRKITPWDAGPIPVQKRPRQTTDYPPPCPDMAFAARQKILDPIPLIVT